MPSYRYGMNRGVLTSHSIALKFALHERGACCNLSEARTYAVSTGGRQKGLCPDRWCSYNGAVLVMQYARPLTLAEFMHRKNALPDWEHAGGEEGTPVESKA